jgi:hypothetical protein
MLIVLSVESVCTQSGVKLNAVRCNETYLYKIVPKCFYIGSHLILVQQTVATSVLE